MKSIHIRLLILAAVAAGIIGGSVAGLLLTRDTATTESAAAILQKASDAQSHALAPLGPNTTLHGASASHRPQPAALRNNNHPYALPDDTTSEVFWTFDGTGKLSAYTSTVKGTDGHLYQHAELVGHDMVQTDVASGQVSTLPRWDSITIADLKKRESDTTNATLATLGPGAQAPITVIDGTPAYMIATTTSRTYIDKNDYHVLRTEELAADGSVSEYTMTTTLEVLPGAVTAFPATPSTTAMATPTP